MTIHTISAGLWRLASWPATLLHELTHMLLALPWAEESAIIVDDVGVAHHVNWRQDTPMWAIVLASLGPTMLGSVVGLVGLIQLVTTPPGTVTEWLLAGAIAGWWTIYAAPSGDDLNIHRPDDRSNQGETT
jgi:hypothetical protein